MTCDEAKILLHALIDGELDAGHAREVEAHIEGCPDCAAELAAYRQMREAIGKVNDSMFGLQTGVFTNDLAGAWQAFGELEVGGVIVNDIPTYRIDHMPYGGVKDSGLGREGLRWAIDDMTEIRIMVLAQPG